MSVDELKKALSNLIDKEDDPAILAAVYTLLNKQDTDSVYRSILTERALQAEEDIKAGRTYSLSEVKKKVKDRFSQ